MSKWWILRLIWLFLGMLTGIIVLLPESAEILTGIVALILILATMVILGRVAVLVVSEKLKSALAKRDPNKTTLARHEVFPGVALEFEAAKVGTEQAPASDSKTTLSRFKFAGFNFKTILNTEEEKLEPRKEALMWDSVLFVGSMIACAWIVSLFN
jgi:hypothetical protein